MAEEKDKLEVKYNTYLHQILAIFKKKRRTMGKDMK
jgi:hypothetical protein